MLQFPPTTHNCFAVFSLIDSVCGPYFYNIFCRNPIGPVSESYRNPTGPVLFPNGELVQVTINELRTNVFVSFCCQLLATWKSNRKAPYNDSASFWIDNLSVLFWESANISIFIIAAFAGHLGNPVSWTRIYKIIVRNLRKCKIISGSSMLGYLKFESFPLGWFAHPA